MRRWNRIALPLAAVLVMAVAVAWTGGEAAAQQTAGTGWERIGPAGRTIKLHTPRTGPLYAQQVGGILRSDDAGSTWTRVKVPAPPDDALAPRFFALDPANHATMYASGPTGLFRATDADDASWQTILPLTDVAYSFSISQADPRVMYLGVSDRPVKDAEYVRLLRSRDGGATWDEIEKAGPTCRANIQLLQAHPSDAQRILRSARCIPAGPSTYGALVESRDQGVSWRHLYDLPGSTVQRLVGGLGVLPQRLYMEMREVATSNSHLVRSFDDGATWSEATPPWASLALPPQTERTQLGGLDYDPTAPDRVYAAVNVHQSNRTPGVNSFLLSRVMLSTDGGSTWSDVGWTGEAEIADLKLGVDGKNLYVVTVDTVWRLPLGAGN